MAQMGGNTGKVIGAFFLLILGIALLTTVSVETNERTSKTSTSENIDYTSAFDYPDINESYVLGPLATLGDTNVDCPITVYSLANSSGTAYTETTDYVMTAGSGTFTLVNTEQVNLTGDNITAVTYTYCPVGYMNLGWGRTGVNIVPGFFAIALMLIAIGMFYSIYKDSKIGV